MTTTGINQANTVADERASLVNSTVAYNDALDELGSVGGHRKRSRLRRGGEKAKEEEE